MKFIHTSDWHLGQVFNGYDREEEHRTFFRRLAGYVSEHRPDALLVSGDVFHNSIPSMAAMKLYNEALLMLHESCPSMSIVVTAGNHDSGSRLEIDRSLWSHFGVSVTGGLARKDGLADMDRHIVPVSSPDGSLSGYVIALPHIYHSAYPAVDQDNGAADAATSDGRQAAFYRALLRRVSEINTSSLPVVMMAHLAVTGCDITGHDVPVGGMDYTPLETFGTGYDYLALGHIHHPQFVGRRGSRPDGDVYVMDAPVARYSGSPVPVSFDEDYPHSVSLVEIGAGKVTVEELPVPVEIPMVTVPEEPLPFDDALWCLSAYPSDSRAYIRLNVRIRDFLPANAVAQVSARIEGKACRYCHIRTVRECPAENGGTASLTAEEFRSLTPLEVASMYYRRMFSSEMDDEMKAMFSELEQSEIYRKEMD